MNSNFTAPPSRVAVSSSAPVNIFRNRERYHLETYDAVSTAGNNSVRADAWKKTLYAKDRLLEDPIPSYLLHDHLVQSHLLSQTQSSIRDPREISLPNFRHSTLSTCHHENRSLYVHAGGKGMDELILRDVRYIPQYVDGELRAEPGFTLPLSRGSPIISVAQAGSSSCNTCSHLLARTSSEVYYMRTVNVTDHLPVYYFDQPPSNALSDRHGLEIILEPLQKWTCPEELVAMATSATRWSYASFLTASGRLYNWNPLGGLTLHSPEPILTGLADLNRGHYSLLGVCPGSLECTLHPQELLAGQGENLYRIDLRTRPISKIHTANSFVTTLKQHGSEQHLCMMGLSDGTIALMDFRNMKKSVGMRILPEQLNEMKYFDISNHYNKNQSIFMGSSPFCRQIYMNNIELVGKTFMEVDSEMKGRCNVFKGGLSSTLLGAAHAFGVQSALRWDVTGHTVLDRSTSQTLWGVDFVPVRDVDIEPSVAEDQDPDKNGELHGVQSVTGVGYLMQQSSIGDIYAQLIQFKRPSMSHCEDTPTNLNTEEKNNKDKKKDKGVKGNRNTKNSKRRSGSSEGLKKGHLDAGDVTVKLEGTDGFLDGSVSDADTASRSSAQDGVQDSVLADVGALTSLDVMIKLEKLGGSDGAAKSSGSDSSGSDSSGSGSDSDSSSDLPSESRTGKSKNKGKGKGKSKKGMGKKSDRATTSSGSDSESSDSESSDSESSDDSSDTDGKSKSVSKSKLRSKDKSKSKSKKSDRAATSSDRDSSGSDSSGSGSSDSDTDSSLDLPSESRTGKSKNKGKGKGKSKKGKRKKSDGAAMSSDSDSSYSGSNGTDSSSDLPSESRIGTTKSKGKSKGKGKGKSKKSDGAAESSDGGSSDSSDSDTDSTSESPSESQIGTTKSKTKSKGKGKSKKSDGAAESSGSGSGSDTDSTSEPPSESRTGKSKSKRKKDMIKKKKRKVGAAKSNGSDRKGRSGRKRAREGGSRDAGPSQSSKRSRSTSFGWSWPKTTVQLGAPCGSVYTQHTLKLRKADDKKDAATKGSELYIRTLLQGSSFSIPNEEFITARAKRWKHYMKLEKPVCDRVYAPFNGDTVTRYPSDSGAFTPFVEEESLKNMDVMTVLPEEVRKDYRMARNGKVLLVRKQDGVLSDIEELRNLFNEKVPKPIMIKKSLIDGNRPLQISVLLNRMARSGGMTLWEIWTHVNQIIPGRHRVNVQTLRQFLLEQSEMTEDILSMGCLPVPAEAKEHSSATTFDGAYVVKHVLHPTDGMTSSRLQNKATGVSVRERKHRTRLRRRAAIEMTTSLVTGDTVEKCTCINSRGQLVKNSSDVPCDHPCCMAPYLISYSIKGKKYDSHVLASHDNYHGTLMRRAAAKEPSLGTHGEHSWEGYSDVSPALMQMLNESWR